MVFHMAHSQICIRVWWMIWCLEKWPTRSGGIRGRNSVGAWQWLQNKGVPCFFWRLQESLPDIWSAHILGLVEEIHAIWQKSMTWVLKKLYGLCHSIKLSTQFFNNVYYYLDQKSWLLSFQVGGHAGMLGRVATWGKQGNSTALPTYLTHTSFHLAVPELYFFIVNL